MNEPQEYINSTCPEQTKFIRDIFEKYLPLIRWEKYGANIMDIGCGPGDLLIDILLPSVPTNFKNLTGCDISENMIEFAKKHYEDERVDFMVLDVETDQLPPELVKQFHHIFSFYCLHLIANHRQAFTNLNHMLKTGGDIFLTYFADFECGHVYKALYETEKWRKHMKNYDRFSFPYLHVDNPKEELEEILKSTEFIIKVCTTLDWHITHKDKNSMKKLLGSINPFVKHMGEDLRDEFMDDHIEGVLRRINCEDTSGELVQPFKMFVVVAEKKKNLS